MSPGATDCGAVCRNLGRHAGSCEHALVNILAPDPLPLAASLRAAIAHHCAEKNTSHASVARAAGLTPSALSRAIREGAEPRPSTVRAILRALRLRMALVDDAP